MPSALPEGVVQTILNDEVFRAGLMKGALRFLKKGDKVWAIAIVPAKEGRLRGNRQGAVYNWITSYCELGWPLYKKNMFPSTDTHREWPYVRMGWLALDIKCRLGDLLEGKGYKWSQIKESDGGTALDVGWYDYTETVYWTVE